MTLVTLLLIWALFLQVLLTVVVLLKMRVVRVKAFKDGLVTMDKIAADHSAWPEDVRQVQNNYANQFEIPVLFFVASLLALTTTGVGWITVIVSWLFVISRWVHMFIHTGSNRIKYRFRAFLFGFICVLILWFIVMVKATQLYLIA